MKAGISNVSNSFRVFDPSFSLCSRAESARQVKKTDKPRLLRGRGINEDGEGFIDDGGGGGDRCGFVERATQRDVTRHATVQQQR